MRLVDRPAIRPGHCAAVPHIGPAMYPEEKWIDTGAEMPGFDNHVYLSATAIRQGMAVLGYASPLEVEELRRELAENEEALMGLLDQIKELDAVLEASETLKAFVEARTKELA